MTCEVRIATIDDRSNVVSTVVAAFRSDPAFRFFFPDDDFYERQATSFAGYLFDKRVRHRSVWVTDGAIGTSLWSPPQPSVVDLSNSGARPDADLRAKMLTEIGSSAADRLAKYDDAVSDAVGDALPNDEPYWYLGVLALHPDYTGSGHGRAVMQAGLEHVRSVGGVACLETSNPRNVQYYQRLDWTVAASLVDTLPIDVWVLTHR
jgi:GNAT superfamily N-acetyltransferase